MKNLLNQKVLGSLCIVLLASLAYSLTSSDSEQCNCTIDASSASIAEMKDIKLNVDKAKKNQLFHVQPIIDSATCQVGIVAVVGEVELLPKKYEISKDSIKSITFRLVHEDKWPRQIRIDSIRKKIPNADSGLKPRVFTFHTSTVSGAVANVPEKFEFDIPREIGPKGYLGDVEFKIDDLPSTSIPRICQFIID